MIIRELKATRKGLFFWCLGVIFIVASSMGKFTGMDASGQSINQFMELMPKAILAVFGMNGLNLNTAGGFYGVIYFLLLIMTAIHAGMLGAGIISKEELDKTSEFLFVKPVSRTTIISCKIIAAVINVIVLNGVSLGISLVMAESIAPEEHLNPVILKLSLALLIVQMIFLFLGTMLASCSKKSSKTAGRASSIVLITYVVSVLSDFSDQLDFLRYMTPFKYFEPRVIVNGGGFEPVFVVLSIAVISVFVGVTYVFFPRRDLSI